jgi:hypothetical protein
MAHWIQINDSGGGAVISVLIELKAHPGRVTAEQGEIDTISAVICTPRQRISYPNFTVLIRSWRAVRLTLLHC